VLNEDSLIEEARRIGHHKTKKEAVRLEILASFGTVDFDPKYDYKSERQRKR
jgi:hypothetical protein